MSNPTAKQSEAALEYFCKGEFALQYMSAFGGLQRFEGRLVSYPQLYKILVERNHKKGQGGNKCGKGAVPSGSHKPALAGSNPAPATKREKNRNAKKPIR